MHLVTIYMVFNQNYETSDIDVVNERMDNRSRMKVEEEF